MGIAYASAQPPHPPRAATPPQAAAGAPRGPRGPATQPRGPPTRGPATGSAARAPHPAPLASWGCRRWSTRGSFWARPRAPSAPRAPPPRGATSLASPLRVRPTHSQGGRRCTGPWRATRGTPSGRCPGSCTTAPPARPSGTGRARGRSTRLSWRAGGAIATARAASARTSPRGPGSTTPAPARTAPPSRSEAAWPWPRPPL
mmetsp:Transcript_55258/g.175759  ORF Transcript_55258/g.175759 Transcript_55258/m.175759 type:complete len:202 (+) Transcript_55258:517-1122(+)